MRNCLGWTSGSKEMKGKDTEGEDVGSTLHIYI
jgi:hypothetical protein